MDEKVLAARCKQILIEAEQALEILCDIIDKEQNSKAINGESSFEMAKQVIKRDGIKEGARTLLGKIKTYAGKQ